MFLLNVSQTNLENVFVMAFSAYMFIRQYVQLLPFAHMCRVEGAVTYVHMMGEQQGDPV